MQGKKLFLDRAVSRSIEWGPHFPALLTACREPGSISRGRQVAVASTDAEGVRCVFFSSLGSTLDFSATWSELEQARSWWYYVRAWHFWILDKDESASRIFAATAMAADHGLVFPTAVVRRQDDAFLRFLSGIEQAAREQIGLAAAA
ncbi:TPA: hypothetical protein QDA71_002389 [Burkholderia vietnamiensis]|uniref:hypothetical protein n=1 Tax=Burkholderia vietnamiensis TaxID=60552 RepID=UPI000758035F|nr:hypothetical protein [Burkholderia vietnamiensis]KVS21203.1 hypothetical protein WK34_22775 [Burkholderia vietnamiensis]MBR7912098.1 hypothetical protein [Burkholderia vietnamiensis]MBR8001785.1 hypothetical protein [Burkholderia vietnamiensis]MBR8014804.1 hypothetical protein [Burkholderia vietnamiensis]MCA7947369.1 hypothetical protein [Burkholderia vietnamiensis]